jgi:hypothetical protein
MKKGKCRVQDETLEINLKTEYAKMMRFLTLL